MAVPQQIHMNAHRASALDSFGGRWPVLLHSITAEHATSNACALGLVVEKTAEGIGLLEVQSAVHAGVIEPFHAKLRLVDGVLTCLAQLLALDGAVAVRRLPTRRGQRTPLYGVTSSLAGGKPRRRRRFDGCSSDDSDSDTSADEGAGANGAKKAYDSADSSTDEDCDDGIA